MAREQVRGVSLDPDDAVRSVGIGPGQAKVTEAFFGNHTFKQGGQAFPAMILIYERAGDALPAEPYTVGQGWKVAESQQALIPRASQTGLPENCKAMHLLRSLKELGMPKGWFQRPEQLVGLDGVLIVKEMGTIKAKKAGEKDSSPTVLVFESITSAPWEESEAPASKGKKKAAPVEDDDDDDDVPAPKKGKKVVEDDDDDDDEDEKPAPKGKKAAPAADDDDEETAAEALVEALGDGPLKLRDVEGAVRAQLKKHKRAEEIAELAATTTFLKAQLGWTFDGKKVSL